MPNPLPNGAPCNRLGLGGEVSHLARQGAADALARLRSLLEGGSPLSAGASLDAAELALMGTDKELKLSAVSRLHALVRDPKTPDAVAVRAARLILVVAGRRSYRGKS